MKGGRKTARVESETGEGKEKEKWVRWGKEEEKAKEEKGGEKTDGGRGWDVMMGDDETQTEKKKEEK